MPPLLLPKNTACKYFHMWIIHLISWHFNILHYSLARICPKIRNGMNEFQIDSLLLKVNKKSPYRPQRSGRGKEGG
jgi:hypothetical protein